MKTIKLRKDELMTILYLLNQEKYNKNKNELMKSDVDMLLIKLEAIYFKFNRT